MQAQISKKVAKAHEDINCIVSGAQISGFQAETDAASMLSLPHGNPPTVLSLRSNIRPVFLPLGRKTMGSLEQDTPQLSPKHALLCLGNWRAGAQNWELCLTGISCEFKFQSCPQGADC